LYRQLADSITRLIAQRAIVPGEKLPATRELAVQLGLNRTTVAAAYSSLEDAGLIRGHVGRGSFVASQSPIELPANLDEPQTKDRQYPARQAPDIEISFANSRPPAEAFPLASFREFARRVIESPEAAAILQLGPTHGYPPLRRFLLDDAARQGTAGPDDDVIVTNGCQQALDLLARVFVGSKTPVACEDPVYHGLIRVFTRAGAELLPISVDNEGIEIGALERIVERHPRLLVITPNFQNPTGATLSLTRRKQILSLVQKHNITLVENDIYTELRYRGEPLPTLKELDESGNTILLRSFSKILFPGLRVGWVLGPRATIARLADAKQISDLHSDQLSQAVMLRFAGSGELQKHLQNTRVAGRLRLEAVLAACARFLPPGSRFTSPDGGMNLWVELPAPLSADVLLARAQERGVDFLPGRYFSPTGGHARGLRISFGALPPEQITRGIEILGECAARELAPMYAGIAEPAAVLV
jgi:DNA-binding transcriptional MocR family regulator